MSTDKYILDGHTPVPIRDIMDWAMQVEARSKACAAGNDPWRVGRDAINGADVSTVFLGLDHSFGGEPPMLFETMIFGGDHDQYQDRYSTWDEAEEGHKLACELAARPATAATKEHDRRAEAFDAGNAEYHAMSGVSNSRLSDFIDDPALYYGRYVADPTLFPRDEPTEAMQFGTNCHAVIQAGSVDAVFTVIPREALNAGGARMGSSWKQFKEENAGRVLVKAEEVEPYRMILANVKAHPKAAAILYGDDGHNEFNIRWTHEETGLVCRARLDRVKPGVCIADIKTTNTIDPRRFSQAIFSLGYHRQAAFYQTAWERYTRETGQFGAQLPFVFIAVRKTPPYTIACYTLSEDYLRRGHDEVDAAMHSLAECYETGHWAGPDEIVELEAPGYAKFQDAWEI